MQQLEDVLRLKQIAQPVVAKVSEVGTRGKGATGQLLDGLRKQDLSAVSR
jgi:hypothetical protein